MTREDLETLLEAIDPVMLLLNLAGWETPRVVIQQRPGSDAVTEIVLPKMTTTVSGTWAASVGVETAQAPAAARIAIACQERTRIGATTVSDLAILFDDELLARGREQQRFFVLHPEVSEDVAVFLRNVFAATESGRRRLIPRIADRWRDPGVHVKDKNVGLLGMYDAGLWSVLPNKQDAIAVERGRLLKAFGAQMWRVLCRSDIPIFLGQESLPRAVWLPEPPELGTEAQALANLTPFGLTPAEFSLQGKGVGTSKKRVARQDIYNLHVRVMDWGVRGWLRAQAPVDSETFGERLDRAEATELLHPWFSAPMPFRAADVRQKSYTRMLMSGQAHGVLDVLGGLSTQSRQQIQDLLAKEALTTEDILVLCRWVAHGVVGYDDAWAVCSRLDRAYPTDAAKALRGEIRQALMFGLTFAFPAAMEQPVEPPPAPSLEPPPAPPPPQPGIFLPSWIELLRRVLTATPEPGAALELVIWTNEMHFTISFSAYQYPSNLAVALQDLFWDDDDIQVRGFAALHAARIWSALLPAEYFRVPFDEQRFAQLCGVARSLAPFSEIGVLRTHLRGLLNALGVPRLHQLSLGDFSGEVLSSLLNKNSVAGTTLSNAESGPLHQYYNCVAGYAYFRASDTSERWRGRIDIVMLMDTMRALESDPQVIALMETAWSEVLDHRLGKGAANTLKAEQEVLLRSQRYMAYLHALDPDARSNEFLSELKRLALLDRGAAHELFKYFLGMLICLSDDLIDAVDNAEDLSVYVGEALKLMGYASDARDLIKILADAHEPGVDVAKKWSKLKDTKWAALAESNANLRATRLVIVTNMVISWSKLKELDDGVANLSGQDIAAWLEFSTTLALAPYSYWEAFASVIPDLQRQSALVRTLGGVAQRVLVKLDSARGAVEFLGKVGKGVFAAVALVFAVQGAWELWGQGESWLVALKLVEATVQAGTVVVAGTMLAGADAIVLGTLVVPLWSISVGLLVVGSGVTIAGFVIASQRMTAMEQGLTSMAILLPDEVTNLSYPEVMSGVVIESFVAPGQYVSAGDTIATLRWHPDVELVGQVMPLGMPLLSLISDAVEDPAKIERILQEGQTVTLRAEMGLKVQGRIKSGERFSTPGVVAVIEPRLTLVVLAAEDGQIVELTHRLGQAVTADEVFARIQITAGAGLSTTAVSSKINGVLVGLFGRVGTIVKKSDPIAWISAHAFVKFVMEP